ncbi:zinc fingers and homeoboxes protein 2 [Ctenopharyngodon idella]|uniref:zinc fingers and homeoboxes protein 2 n=1 Tax=Ctenopharyngodon idella TaxID=7959 RepID=UPI0022327483|nr:zinc fingers and homeoboxes protein 2 [Ctenopharyngodon idella]XP_051729250.1 zinc fingers and homeoboxes protein 2 [Ctenopharyngodon idella]
MSSRRKSSNPCVVHATCFTPEESVEMDVSVETVLDRYAPVPSSTDESGMSLNDEEEEKSDGGSAPEPGSFCNYRDHEDFCQSEGPASTFYVCTFCNFRTNHFDSLSCHNKVQHPNESRFKFRQTMDCENDGSLLDAVDFEYELGPLVHSSSSAGEETGKTTKENSSILEKGLEVEKELDSPVLKDEIRAVSVNGTIIIPEPMCHVTPLLQRPPNLSISPTIAVPLHTSKYNPILDSNTTLITSFNRFPYPTHAELSWLTAASKHPEEQIKVWFTTQRLKQGITWSPEEVEEARKKMFNGSIPPPHQTCAVSPTPAGEPFKPGQAICHVFGQTSLPPYSTANISPTTCTPATFTAVRQTQTLKRSLGTPLLASEVKRPVVPPTGDPKESLRMPPPPAPPPERLAIASFPGFLETKTSSPAPMVASDMKRPVAANFVPPKGKLPMVQSKDKIPAAIPSVVPKERLPLSPIVSTNLKRSLIHQRINNRTSATFFVPKNKLSCFGNGVTAVAAVTTPQVNRPTIIQSLSAVPLSPSPTPVLQCKSTEPPMFPCFSSQNGKEIPHGDVKHWFFDQTTISQNDSQNSCVEFALRERSVPTHFPLLERVKDKSPGQIKLLEESFQRNSFPPYNEVQYLMITTRLSREEIESWFLERRALRDDLEQALLNSMGSKQESQQPVLNGAQRRSGPHTFSPVPPNSKSVNLLKNVFVQNRWPSPVEFRHLEMQTRLPRTELVRWFRDGQLAQQSHVLDRKEVFGERNGCWAADSTKRPSPKERPLREENSKPSSPEIENWFNNMPGQHTGSNGEVIEYGRGDCGGKTCEPLSDSS